ncbi:acyltransferase family protein [Hymenobacter cellulosilyticus]|uniref:Acyltransferase n=1 Tax=Hymenobacter cellulosilyticus TaxID=2932248 RepID=A0A8T9Q3D2_9BACT|nr:acyltransferase [Hymenobacter cellulosilyticus]UOQ72246.1 acyltransferase [Hymenobacter cellulosilyticus]
MPNLDHCWDINNCIFNARAPFVMTTATATIKPPIKLQYINALRGLAILGVILVHNLELFDADKPMLSRMMTTFISQGARGVQLFFVASAFTLWLSMSRRKEEKHPTRNFFLRRFFRIAPLYYLGVAFYSLFFTTVHVPMVTVSSLLANLTFLHGLRPEWIHSIVPGGWSITVEMWFYCLAPLLFSKLKTVDHCVRFIVFSILASALLSIVLVTVRPSWLDFVFYYFPSQLPIFGFGILLYFLLVRNDLSKTIKPSTWLLAAGVSLLLLLTGLPYHGVEPAGKHYLFGAAFMVLAYGLSQYNFRLLVNPIINYIGEVSFSLYLVHFAVMYAVRVMGYAEIVTPNHLVAALANFGIRYVLVLIISLCLATLLYRLVEVPFQNGGKRLIEYLER